MANGGAAACNDTCKQRDHHLWNGELRCNLPQLRLCLIDRQRLSRRASHNTTPAKRKTTTPLASAVPGGSRKRPMKR